MHSFFSLFSLLCIPTSYFLPLFLHFSLITFFYFIAFLHFPFFLRLITFLLSPLSQLSSCISPISQFTLLLTLFPLYNPYISFSYYSFHSTVQSSYSFSRSSFLYYLSYSYYGTKKLFLPPTTNSLFLLLRQLLESSEILLECLIFPTPN